MKKNYAGILFSGAGMLLLTWAAPAHAQHIFTDNSLGPYQQNFDGPPAGLDFRNNRTWPGVYALAEADAGTMPAGYPTFYSPARIAANDGTAIDADYYHFGAAASDDRAFGGIASTRIVSATGYVGIRFRNNSSLPIRNLEIQYAMEQWYNSGRQDQARVGVSYLKGAVGDTLGSLMRDAGSWTDIPALAVDAPSTATAIASRDGNAPSNRRVRQATLENVDLLPNQEIMIRWDYVLNSSTNGNGLSLDDVVVTPVTKTFFLADNQPGALDNWRSNPTGSGAAPTSFTADNQTFYIIGHNVDATGLTISGANSKVVVGTATQPASLIIAANTPIHTPIDVAAGSTLLIKEAATSAPATFRLGALSSGSTVAYAGEHQSLTVLPANYGHLQLTGSGTKTLGGSIIVNGDLTLDGTQLHLGDYDATVNRGGSVHQTQPTDYVVTDGAGLLRQTVSSDSRPVLYPVGTAGAYLPVTLQQSKERSEDVFQVRVADQLYSHYDVQEQGNGPAVANNAVRNTWFVSEEVAGNSDLTMTLGWRNTDATADFNPAQAYLSHYHGGSWDRAGAPLGATGSGPFTVTRSGLSSFSPFGVWSPTIMLPTAATRRPTAVAVVPNPGTGRFELVNSQAAHAPLQGVVIDVLGKEVLRVAQPAGSARTSFDLSNQPAGLYLLRLTGEAPQTLRIVKQ